MINWIKKIIAKRKIPKGDFCYTCIGPGGKKNCPHHQENTIQPCTGVIRSYCSYLKQFDCELDDGIKICGINKR